MTQESNEEADPQLHDPFCTYPAGSCRVSPSRPPPWSCEREQAVQSRKLPPRRLQGGRGEGAEENVSSVEKKTVLGGQKKGRDTCVSLGTSTSPQHRTFVC